MKKTTKLAGVGALCLGLVMTGGIASADVDPLTQTWTFNCGESSSSMVVSTAKASKYLSTFATGTRPGGWSFEYTRHVKWEGEANYRVQDYYPSNACSSGSTWTRTIWG